MRKTTKILLLSISGILLLTSGVLVGIIITFRWQFYPLPTSLSIGSDQGDSDVKIALFSPDRRPLIGNEDGSIIIEFHDTKNNAPIKRVIVSAKTDAEASFFFDDSKRIMATIGNHILFVYDKQTRQVSRHDFDSENRLITITPDQQSFIAYQGDSQKIVMLDWSGKILLEQSLGARLDPINWQFFDQGKKLAFLTTNPDPETPGKLFIWDLVTNTLTEDTRPAISETLDSGRSYSLVIYDLESDALYLSIETNAGKWQDILLP